MLGPQPSDGLGEDLPEIMEGAVFYEKRNQTLFKGAGVLQQPWPVCISGYIYRSGCGGLSRSAI